MRFEQIQGEVFKLSCRPWSVENTFFLPFDHYKNVFNFHFPSPTIWKIYFIKILYSPVEKYLLKLESLSSSIEKSKYQPIMSSNITNDKDCHQKDYKNYLRISQQKVLKGKCYLHKFPSFRLHQFKIQNIKSIERSFRSKSSQTISQNEE